MIKDNNENYKRDNVFKKNDCAAIIINSFTEDIKKLLRDQLAEICHGKDYVATGRITYSYKFTLKEFLKRYENKSKDIKIGMIGELLVHLIIKIYFDEYKSVTPYFNMEERSIKKGYDVVLTEVNSAVIWIIEVKAGELHIEKNANQTINDLIGTAKSDLHTRLNEENASLWLEAINAAKISFDNNDVMKEAILDILFDWSDDAVKGIYSSMDKNVILSGVLFTDTKDCVTYDSIKQKQMKIEKSNGFKRVYVIGIQKGTYTAIYNFLKDEALDEK